jgi:hypothetical protein
MLKRFTEGLVFGGGFAVAFFAISYAADFLLSPTLLNYQLQRIAGHQPIRMGGNIPSKPMNSFESSPDRGRPFDELTPDEQIKHASVIALATYEKQPDGRMVAIIKEFLKKDPNTAIYYNIGDEYPESSYSPKVNTIYGDGVLIFFTESPTTMKMSLTYSGDRIRSLGDMPMNIFKSKCKNPSA